MPFQQLVVRFEKSIHFGCDEILLVIKSFAKHFRYGSRYRKQDALISIEKNILTTVAFYKVKSQTCRNDLIDERGGDGN